jgi:hypothetical protein
MDFGSFLVAPAALAFFDALGGAEVVRLYNNSLCAWAAAFLADAWKTELLVEPRLCASMCMIRTPFLWQWFVAPGVSIEAAASDKGLPERVAVAVFAFSGVQSQFIMYNGAIYTRISAQVPCVYGVASSASVPFVCPSSAQSKRRVSLS